MLSPTLLPIALHSLQVAVFLFFFIPTMPSIKTEHEPGREKPFEVGTLLPGKEQSFSILARREIKMA